jgi:hypothetical protein
MLDIDELLAPTGDAEVDYYLWHMKAAYDDNKLDVMNPDVKRVIGL